MHLRTLAVFGTLLLVMACDYKPRNQGRALYEEHCQNCHMAQGEGLGKLVPPVANSDYVVAHRSELACMIRHGMSGAMEVNGVMYEGEMAGNLHLSDVEINNLLHYILIDLNGEKEHYDISDVRTQLAGCPIE